jgi:hypothetical protein
MRLVKLSRISLIVLVVCTLFAPVAIAIIPSEFDTFLPTSNLSSDNDDSGNLAKGEMGWFDVAADGDFVSLVWQDSRLDDPFGVRNREVFIRTSADGGKTWGKIFNISAAPKSDWEPRVAVNGNTSLAVFGTSVLFCDGCPDVLRIVRFQNGLRENVFEGKTGGVSVVHPQISNFNKIFVATAGEIPVYFTASIDNGATWLPLQNWKPTGGAKVVGGGRSHPFAFSDGKIIYHVARGWIDEDSKRPELILRRSEDFGRSWKSDQRLTTTAQEEFAPVIYGNDNEVFIAYGVLRSENQIDIMVTSSRDSGQTWTSAAVMTTLAVRLDASTYYGPILNMKKNPSGGYIGILNRTDLVFSDDGLNINSRKSLGNVVRQAWSMAVSKNVLITNYQGTLFVSAKAPTVAASPSPAVSAPVKTPLPTPSTVASKRSTKLRETTIVCNKGKTSLRVTGKKPICPVGYKKVATK